MREKSHLLIKFCVTRTDPATETNGWRCRPTLWRRVFCSSSRQFHCDTKFHNNLPGLVPSRQLCRDTMPPTLSQDWQKTRHRDTVGT